MATINQAKTTQQATLISHFFHVDMAAELHYIRRPPGCHYDHDRLTGAR